MSQHVLLNKQYMEGLVHAFIFDYEETEHDFETRLCVIVNEFDNCFDVEMSLPNGLEQCENIDQCPIHEYTYHSESFRTFKSQSIKKLKSYVVDALEVLTEIDRKQVA